MSMASHSVEKNVLRTPRWAVLALLTTGCLALGCERERRRFGEIAPLSALAGGHSHSSLSPGNKSEESELPRNAAIGVQSPYDDNAWAVSEGKRLYTYFNCNGCHGQGGGGEGPALMNNRFRYGSEAGNVFATVVEGRPNGMPSYRGKLTQQEAWQLTAYVRALAGQVRLDVQPGRSDTLNGHPSEMMLKHRGVAEPRPEGVP